MLTALLSKTANNQVIEHALNNTPSLIIDCANVVNPHAFFPFFEQDTFKNVFVVQAELLYTFRDIFKEVRTFAHQIGTNTVLITSFHRLFNYQDEDENNNIYEEAWKKMKELSQEFDIRVAVHKTQEARARQYCDVVTMQ